MTNVYDYLGVGFGPSNLSLAIATRECMPAGRQPVVGFLEQKAAFGWHEGMLIDGSTMQISFLKDLATLRNPCSRFTFINYLREQGRLEDFINLQTFFPAREEYNDYLGWAAAHFDDQVQYGHRVEAVTPWMSSGRLQGMDVISRDQMGREQRYRARHLVLGLGGAPQIPDAFNGVDDRRVFHSSGYRDRIEAQMGQGDQRPRVAVLGGGQSAAEIFEDITRRFPQAEATLIMRGSALKPSDDSPFVNEIFNPSYIDQIYRQSPERRAHLLSEFRNTNYAVVDLELIERVYQTFYLQKLRNDHRHHLLTCQEIVGVTPNPQKVQLALRDRTTGACQEQGFDAVVLATGYRRDQHISLLDGLQNHLEGLEPDRNYRLRLRDNQARIYLQGCCELSHGLSDTLLSVLAVRSREIVNDIFGTDAGPQPAVDPLALSMAL